MAKFDFDHIDPSTKCFNVSKGASESYSRRRIDAEIAKFRFLCSVCHARTRVSSGVAFVMAKAPIRGFS